MAKYVVAVAMPTYDGTCRWGAAKGHMGPGWANIDTDNMVVHPIQNPGSLLGNTFNGLWYNALNCRKKAGLTHWGMIHADVVPLVAGWISIGIREMEAKGCSICSAVIPLKDDRGLTSTGVYVKGKSGEDNVRRITMRELYGKLPDTFDNSDLRQAGFEGDLVVNTGLWVCKLTEPWVDQCFFTVTDVPARDEEGNYSSRTLSEDWRFTRMAQEQGVKVCATRKMYVEHWGPHHWDNTSAWGEWERDEEFFAG